MNPTDVWTILFLLRTLPLDIHRPSASRHTAVVLAQELPISHSVKLSRASVINPLSEPLLASNASRHEDDMGSNYVEHYLCAFAPVPG